MTILALWWTMSIPSRMVSQVGMGVFIFHLKELEVMDGAISYSKYPWPSVIPCVPGLALWGTHTFDTPESLRLSCPGALREEPLWLLPGLPLCTLLPPLPFSARTQIVPTEMPTGSPSPAAEPRQSLTKLNPGSATNRLEACGKCL